MLRRLVPFGCAAALACDPAPRAAEAEKAPAPAKAEPEPAPERGPAPPAPPGTVEIDGRWVFTCAEPGSCPTLVHAPGAAHCEALALASAKWRLPTIAELESWRGNEKLHAFDVFHWSGSAWEEDPTQLWIYDPGSGAKTTAPPTRKPFTIRCVADRG